MVLTCTTPSDVQDIHDKITSGSIKSVHLIFDGKLVEALDLLSLIGEKLQFLEMDIVVPDPCMSRPSENISMLEYFAPDPTLFPSLLSLSKFATIRSLDFRKQHCNTH